MAAIWKQTYVHVLTYWGRVTQICVDNLTIIGSDNGLSPGRRQSIIRTNAWILLIGPLGTHFSEILIGIQTFSFKRIYLKMSSAKRRPFCLGLNVLKSLCIVEGYWGWMDRTHDVMTVICYAPLIWWPGRGMCGMDLKRVYCRYDSQCYVHGSRWLSEMVRFCVNTWWDVTGNVETFKTDFCIQPQQKTIWQYRWRDMGTTELPVLFIFCRFLVNGDGVTTVMRHAYVRDLFIATAAKRVPRRDWNASAISKLQF